MVRFSNMANRRYTVEEAVRILMDIPGNGDESEDENVVGGEGDIVQNEREIESDESESDNDDFVQPSTSRGRGRGRRGQGRGGRGGTGRKRTDTVDNSRQEDPTFPREYSIYIDVSFLYCCPNSFYAISIQHTLFLEISSKISYYG